MSTRLRLFRVTTHIAIHRLFTCLLIIGLLCGPLAPITSAQTGGPIFLPIITNGPTHTAQSDLLFRTRVTVNTPAQWRELERLGVVILDKDDNGALLLVDDEQLETLARLRYNPDATNTLETLAAAQATVQADFGSLLIQLATVQAQVAIASQSTADGATIAASRQSLRTTMQALSTSQLTTLAQAAAVDSDGDGLTDDQELWWCTDKNDVDSDFDGVTDGAEVTALKAWMGNKLWKFPESGKPFDQWPPDLTGCSDSDKDSVPDRAESRELGLNSARESTDRDKFDDGQEIFGQTNCTGQGGFCSYGPLPRNEDWGVIFAEMPSWVKAPGNHPLVAAFPVPEIDVAQSSLKVETVTEVTTDHVISEGTEKSYSTAKTEGVGTSLSDTETWNSWQEVSVSKSTSRTSLAGPLFNTQLGKLEFEAKTVIQGCNSMAGSAAALGAASGATSGCVNNHVGTIQGAENINFDLAGSQLTDEVNLLASDLSLDNIGSNNLRNNCISWNCEERTYTADVDTTNNIVHGTQDNSRSLLQMPINLSVDASGNTINRVVSQKTYNITYPVRLPQISNTKTSGKSNGGSHTTSSSKYEEHTVTNGEAFSNEESWGNATAVNSAHAADFWFTYKVLNTGTEYAREIGDLAFNLYIGDDPNPAYTYFVAPDIGGSGKFQNFMPTEEHQYTSRRIPLSLNQMKAIDLGGPIRIVVEDFSYGIDELFYQDAANAGMLIALEDGTTDNDESIETYLIPTWGSETVLQVLARYFPHETDTDGTLIAIWTPEYQSTIPAWCQSPRRPTDFPNKAVWCKHALSTADWWNVYTDGLGDGSEGFQDTAASPGATALFRFNQDTDLDGFSDRSEARLGTDAKDASSFPQPEVLAGVHNLRSGNRVTSTLSLLNRGIYDAYGVEAVMVAPDDSVSITNNTVGGSGRVRALKEVIVGSSIKLPTPLPAPWGQNGKATPAAGGYYIGNADRTYTFTVNCTVPGGECEPGTESWAIAWNDGKGASGNLAFGDEYQSPLFQPVGTLGMTLALYSGKVNHGSTFTVQARTPRDTFQYTINREPYTEPLVIVSYNDPQGNHRFVIPTQAMSLTLPTSDLNLYAGQMLADVGVELVTTAPFAVGANSVNLLVNNPSDKSLQNAHLFLEMINISGTVVAEIPTQVTLAPGPQATTVTFDTSTFSPAYTAGEDYIVMAFLTDYQGNILDTAGRPLSSFQVDPQPALVVDQAALTWNFGTLPQGALAKYPLTLANTGFGRLYTYFPTTPGLTLNQTGGQTIGAADSPRYDITLRTADLPVGPIDQTVTLATSDPARPTLAVRVVGTVVDAPAKIAPSATRPLDLPVVVTGPYNQGHWLNFAHELGPDAQSLHPVKVYSENYNTMYGVGKYATEFSSGTASTEMFGDGRDGVMPTSGNLDYDQGFGIGIVDAGTIGSTNINVTDAYAMERINPGDVVLIHQTQGSSAGCWELNKAMSDFGNSTATYQLTKPLKCNYSSGGSNKAQILRVPQYSTCNVTGTTTPISTWNGAWGGIFTVMCSGSLHISGEIDTTGLGFRGGTYKAGRSNRNGQGEGDQGNWNNASSDMNTNGGGGGRQESGDRNFDYGGGGGGGNATNGGNAEKQGAQGGSSSGSSDLTILTFGGGGGVGGGPWDDLVEAGNGGNGGGAIIIFGRQVMLTGILQSNGTSGFLRSGGGGAGGSIFVAGQTILLNNKIDVKGSSGDSGKSSTGFGGAGSDGRIRIEYCESLTGTTNPPASTQKLDCYITEQVEASPYTTARLNLPEAVDGTATYNIQFGRILDFANAGTQTTHLRVPAGLYSSVHFDTLISRLPTTATLTLDVGNDGTIEWTGTAANNATKPSPDLAAAFTTYWRNQGSPTTATLDVPIEVALDQPGQILLTNLQVATTSSHVQVARLPLQTYTTFQLDFTLGGTGTVALDVGDNGSIDWSTNAMTQRQVTANLASFMNAYLAGKSGTVDVPLRFYVSPDQPIMLNDYTATTSQSTDLVAVNIQVNGSAVQAAAQTSNIQEGDLIPVQATLRNGGTQASGPVTAAFFAHAEGWGDWYIGSAFIENLAVGAQIQVNTLWNTTGFSGTLPVKVVINPYGRVAENKVDNNTKTETVTVQFTSSIPTSTPTPKASNTPVATPSNTSIATPTHTPSNTPIVTASNTPVATPTNTPVVTASNTPMATASNTPVAIPTNTPVVTASNTPMATASNTPVATPTNTPSNTPVVTASNTPVATPTHTPMATQTNTPVHTPTSESTATSTPSATEPLPTDTATRIPTSPPTLTPTATGISPTAVVTVIPPSGGFVSGSPSLDTLLTFPPGSVSDHVQISMGIDTNPPATGSFQVLGQVFRIEAENEDGNAITTFGKPYTIVISYTEADLKGMRPEDLQLHYYDSDQGSWQPIPTQVDMVARTITATLDHLTQFAVLAAGGQSLFLPIVIR